MKRPFASQTKKQLSNISNIVPGNPLRSMLTRWLVGWWGLPWWNYGSHPSRTNTYQKGHWGPAQSWWSFTKSNDISNIPTTSPTAKLVKKGSLALLSLVDLRHRPVPAVVFYTRLSFIASRVARQDFGARISARRRRQGGVDGRAALGGGFGPGVWWVLQRGQAPVITWFIITMN